MRNLSVSLLKVFGVFCCCKFQGYIRWPVRGEHSEHPYVAFKTLDHNHPVDKDVVDKVRRQTTRLDTSTKDACGKLTGE